MRIPAAVFCVFAMVGVANADFAGPWAPENWTLNNPAGGFASLNEIDMHLTSGDVSTAGVTEYVITVSSDVTLWFDWDYASKDSGPIDFGYYSLNGVQTLLADNGDSPAYGTAHVFVEAGRTFALGVETADGMFGPGNMWVNNFTPEPGSLALIGIGALALLRRR